MGEAREVLVVENARKYFGGVRAVDDVTLKLLEREILSIVGPNGAGKTTLLNIVFGVIKPDKGRVLLRVGDKFLDVTGWPPRRLVRIGLARAFQTPSVFNDMTVIDNVRAAIIARKKALFSLKGYYALGDVEEEAWQLLDYFGLGDKAYVLAKDLSHGERKLLDIVLALASRPRVLLLDEPTAGLSASEKQTVMEIIKRLRDDMGVSVIVVEHDLDVVFGVSDRVVVMYEGRVLAEGPPSVVQEDERVRTLYLGEEEVKKP
ncbi:ABC transporter ATP-binding protein [Pyrofollis japonicus]|uniref:ABC transporter ATP-binding protein n=1 Tax=Pyrofollis japonicus TaxID=3060460 RepID=UPI00295C2A4D|nr:ABC transporter ATP-binding protein [Pyrofollis japonicus]BEP17300.1 ABC transporter ATP-binding protein [Pyrofollis japonicus]